MRRHLMFATFAWLLSHADLGLGGTIILSDAEFANSDYATQTDGSFTPNSNFSTVGTQVPIGGNPGAFRQVTNFAQNFGLHTEVVYGWHFNTAQPYDPAEGAIVSLDYSEDSIFVFGQTQQGYLAVRQDDLLFRSKESFTTGASNTSFTNNQLTGLTATDFEGLFNGTFFPTANPDFSLGGSPVEFGFLRLSTDGGGVNDSSGIDNWTVTLTTDPIPEPASLFIGLVGLVALVRCGRA